MGVAPETIFMVILYFEIALVGSPNIITVTKSKQRSVCMVKFVILQSIGIRVTIKSSETRAVIYTSRYSSGQFNPYNSANGLN